MLRQGHCYRCSASRIQTFSNWVGRSAQAEDDDSDDEGQAYYAGGSETRYAQHVLPKAPLSLTKSRFKNVKI